MAGSGKILVTGAGGALGSLVVDALRRAGEDVIAGSRTPAKLEALSRSGVQVRRIDFDDVETLHPAFREIERVLIVSTDELSKPGRRQRQHQAALDGAVAAGVRHIAYTSMPNPIGSVAIPFAPDHSAMEAGLIASGAGYTILRNGWYQENLLGYLPQILADGTWYTSAGEGRISFIARADAAQATATLLRTAEKSDSHDFVGPEALTIDEIAAIASRVLGHPLRVEHVSDEQAGDELSRQGVHPQMVPMAVVTDANQRAGMFDVGAGAVPALLDRPMRTLAQFFEQHRDHLLTHVGM